MRTMIKSKPLTILLAGLLTILSACTSSPDARLYILESAGTNTTTANSETKTVFVSPVVLPDYLKRDEIVYRSGAHRIEVAQYDRWAEPLDRNITSVIAANLTSRFGAENVIDYYSNFSAQSDMTLRVRILEFVPTEDNNVILKAVWELAQRGQGEALFSREIDIPVRSGVLAQNIDSTVRAMSEALNQLSQEIANSIEQNNNS